MSIRGRRVAKALGDAMQEFAEGNKARAKRQVHMVKLNYSPEEVKKFFKAIGVRKL